MQYCPNVIVLVKLIIILLGSCSCSSSSSRSRDVTGRATVVAHHEHEGCGMHHPLVQQQHALLRRRLLQLRELETAAAAADADSSDTQLAKRQQQQQQQQEVRQDLRANALSSSSHSKGGNASRPQRSNAVPAAAPIRIQAVYQLTGLSGSDKKRVKQQLVPAAIRVLQRYVNVISPSRGPLKFDALFGDGQQACLTSKVDPKQIQGKLGAKNTDLVLYITSDKHSCLSGMIAMATACDVDRITRRPILGSLNICNDALKGLTGLKAGSDAEATAIGRVVEVLVHEIIHVLGFGATHYDDWRGPNGKRYGQNNVIKEFNGRPYLATPKVTAVARKFFGCEKLPGAPLENEGPSFSAISHFEYRLLQRELMGPARPIDRSRSRLSALTLAALEDTGWYTTNKTAVEVLDWGRGAGCDFVLDDCWDFMNRHKRQAYYCGKGSVNETRCTAEAAGWGVCRTNAFSDGCLLVGKYSLTSAAAVAAGLPSSIQDGRQAACYNPPQLQALSRRTGTQAPLLPLLGGSYGAQRSDICYNVIRPQYIPRRDDVVWVNGHGQIPEDVGKYPAAGGSGGGHPSRQQQQRQQRQQQPQQQQQRSGPAAQGRSASSYQSGQVFSYMDGGTASTSIAAAACVRMAAAGATDDGGGWYGSGSGRRLSAAADILSSSNGRQLAAAAAVTAADSAFALNALQGATAACVASPILCFKSSCDKQGKLWITVQQSRSSSSSSSSNSGSSRFACPSGQTVDLSKSVPGRYLLGYLQCPSNALVCETMGCGQCSSSGGYCSRGKCHCHMERYGAACRKTLVPKFKL